jgi:hypothetical protein
MAKPRLVPSRTIHTTRVSVPYRLRDTFLAKLPYIPIWHQDTKQWSINIYDGPRIRPWLDEELSKPWPKKAA